MSVLRVFGTLNFVSPPHRRAYISLSKPYPNEITFPHHGFFPIKSVTKSSTARFSHENLVEKIKICVKDFVPIRTALIVLLLLLPLFLSLSLRVSLFKDTSHNNIAISLPALLFFPGLRAVKVGTGKVVGNGTGTVRERERLRYFLSRPMFPDLSRY